jgi:hypothetical protein
MLLEPRFSCRRVQAHIPPVAEPVLTRFLICKEMAFVSF